VKKLVIAFASVALFGLSQMAVADDYTLSYSAKELANSDGVTSVHKRIVKAAKDYCPTYSQIRNVRDVQSCVDGVVDDLVNKVGHPRLSSYHANDNSVRIASS
jgi:UrcA family protein